MAICKYFAEGRCRFGDRCHFEHIVDNRYRYQGRNQDYSESYSTPRHNQYNEYRNSRQYGNAYEKDDSYEQYQPREQNKYSWTSADSVYSHRPSKYDSFSFKLPQTENRDSRNATKPFTNSTTNRFEILERSKVQDKSGEDESNAESVKEDMIAWEEGKQWPFTCYFPFKGHPGLLDFEDMSSEELRYKAYEAEKNNSFPSYVKSVTDAMETVQQKRNLLKNPTPDAVHIINKIAKEKLDLGYKNEQTTFSGATFLSGGSALSGDTSKVLFGKSTPASNFSFNLNHLSNTNSQRMIQNEQMDSSNFSFTKPSFSFTSSKDKASSFSFKLAASELNIKQPDHVSTKMLLYTLLVDLTSEETEAFNASVFTLTKIPERPPPLELCF